MFLLDVGTENGVAVFDPVVVARGLVGVVREVSQHTALAMDWTHPDFGVSVMTEDGEIFGIAGPQQGSFREEDRLVFDGIPYYSSVVEGAIVVTSGRGPVYPRGILVGEVLEAAESEVGWRKSYWIRPAVAPGSATHVLVLTGGAAGTAESLGELWGVQDALDSLGTAPSVADFEIPEAAEAAEEPSP
jgi:rod shape-determining protein MreC